MPDYNTAATGNRIDSRSLADYLTCGQCAQEFPLKNITNFIEHKTVNCDNTIIDKVEVNTEQSLETNSPDIFYKLSCSSCLQEFVTARGLLHHVQFRHNFNIFISQDATGGNSTDRNNGNLTLSTSSAKLPSCCENKETDDTNCPCRKFGRCSLLEYNSTTSDSDQPNNKPQKCVSTRCSTMAVNRGTTICCNSQECCVTIIPGTHEEPRKCCNSVLPKKRKMHMLKHMDKSKKKTPSIDQSSMIFIDVGQQDQDSDTSPREMTPTTNLADNPTRYSPTGDNNDSSQSDEDTDRRDSVIIETGNQWSIPITVTSEQVEARHNRIIYQTPSFMSRTTNNHTKIDIDYDKIDEALAATLPLDCDSNTLSHDKNNQSESSINTNNMMISNMTEDLVVDEDNTEREGGKKRRYPTSRPYKCKDCTEAFNQRIHLKKHMSKHTGVKPFKCQQCDYSTVERSHLKVHIRIHTGEKPFKCIHCKYATAQNSTLKIHLMRRHGGKMFQCELCFKTFTQQIMLENHKSDHQKVIPSTDFQSLPSDINLPELDSTFNSTSAPNDSTFNSMSAPIDSIFNSTSAPIDSTFNSTSAPINVIPVFIGGENLRLPASSNDVIPALVGEEISRLPASSNQILAVQQVNQTLINHTVLNNTVNMSKQQAS